MTREHLTRFADKLDLPVGLLAILVIPALVIEDHASAPELLRVAFAINWIVWIAFCSEFALRFAGTPTWQTVRANWFDVLLIGLSPPFLVPQYLQATRSLRLVRLLRLLRLMRLGAVAALGLRYSRKFFVHRKFHFVGLVAVAVVLLGALGIFLVEGDTNASAKTYGDALWWSIVTATTVGYGDVSPATTEGRIIAIFLMLTGIGVIGVFTATVASFFFENQQAATPVPDVEARLNAIEAKLDQLLAERRER